MFNGSGNGYHSNLVEFTRLGLIHSPTGRLLTSETFQGSLNVQGASLKRKQIWTLYTDTNNPTAFLLKNHLGRFLSADRNGNVSLIADQPGEEERFVIHFDPNASGEVALQSEKHGFFLQWTGSEMRCFSKEPVWWGIRLGMHPQIHLRSVHRSCFIRSATKDTQLRAVTKMPSTSKFLLWLQQLPLPPASSTAPVGKNGVAQLSRVAIRTQSGRYLHGDGTLVDSIEQATLFAVSFKPSATPALMFQDEHCQYLTVAAGGVLKIKMGVREPRREELFSVETPSNQVRLWGVNNKFACNKHGLTFATTMEETEDHKDTIYELEYVGGRGVNMGALVSAAATPSAENSPTVFGFDGVEDGVTYLTTGLWRLRAQDGRLWQFPPSGCAELAPKDSTDPATTFELLYLPTYMDVDDGGNKRVNPRGGVVIRTSGGVSVAAKPLGAIGTTDRRPDSAAWSPVPAEVIHILPMINRTSVAVYSPLACGYLSPAGQAGGSGMRRGGGGSAVDCTSCVVQQWFLRPLIVGTTQFLTKIDNQWMLLTASTQGSLSLAPSNSGPEESVPMNEIGSHPETEFVIFMTSDKYALIRALISMGGQAKTSYLCTNLQGNVKLDASGTITPGCIWQL